MSAGGGPAGPSTGGRPFSVLLADDVADLRELYRLALERRGRFVVVGEAADGAEAVRQAQATAPDLILLDLSMPTMDGLEALPKLRTVAPDAKIVVLSGFERDRMWQPVATAGAYAYIEKGTRLDVLVDELVLVCGALDVIEGVLAEAQTSLDADVRSAATARRFLTEVLDRWNCSTEIEVVKLGITELVANAVTHAGVGGAAARVEVTVRLTPTGLRIAVADSDPAMPVLRHVGTDAESGRGMALIDTLASRWGIDDRPHGKSVWFEVPRLDRAP